jgi:hypothetical protein
MPKLQQPHGRRGEAMVESVDWAAVAVVLAGLAILDRQAMQTEHAILPSA